MDREKLLEEMDKKGISVGEMGKRLGMSRSAFYRKTKGISEFTVSEIQKIIVILGLESPIDIFFSKKVS